MSRSSDRVSPGSDQTNPILSYVRRRMRVPIGSTALRARTVWTLLSEWVVWPVFSYQNRLQSSHVISQVMSSVKSVSQSVSQSVSESVSDSDWSQRQMGSVTHTLFP